jgi:arylsulfatase A-like enzyme
MLAEVGSSAPVNVQPYPLLQVDRSQARPPFNLIFILLESTNRMSTSLAEPIATPEGDALEPLETRMTKLSLDPGFLRRSEVTPVLKRLADEGLEVVNTYAGASHSSKALTGILCGQYPYPDVRVLEADGILLNRCLPELLAEGGFETGFFQAPKLEFESREKFARAMGYQTVMGGKRLNSQGFMAVNYFGFEDRILLKPVVDWVAERKQPYFLTVFTGTTHHPYGSPGVRVPGPKDKLVQTFAHYQHALRYVDSFVGELLAGIAARRGLENTLVVVLGDHGEAFGEQGLRFHDWTPYEAGNRIPLVLWGDDVLGDSSRVPGFTRGARVEGLRHQIDLMPTILDLLGWKVSEGLPGLSLFGTPGHDRVWSSCWSGNQCMSMREGNLKYVVSDWVEPLEVYDLEKDPLQKHNIASSMSEESLKQLRTELWTHKQTVSAHYRAVEQAGKRE